MDEFAILKYLLNKGGFMKINIKASVIAISAVALAACVSTTTTIHKDNRIYEKKLANGQPVRVGMTAVKNEWVCTQLDANTYNWAQLKYAAFKKYWNKDHENDYFQDQAIDYANQHNLQPNYIYLVEPDEVQENDTEGRLTINTTLNKDAKAQAYFYKCINPPAVKGGLGIS
jgi:hypothetical protein